MKLFRKKNSKILEESSVRKDKPKMAENPDYWLTYQDEFQRIPILAYVNTALLKKDYRHTLYVMIPYVYSRRKPFPDEQELVSSKWVKEQIDHILIDHDNIMFIGNAAYGGNVHLLYVSDDDVNWLDLIQVEGTVKVGKYENDKMKYYNRVMYPPHIRTKYMNESMLDLTLEIMSKRH